MRPAGCLEIGQGFNPLPRILKGRKADGAAGDRCRGDGAAAWPIAGLVGIRRIPRGFYNLMEDKKMINSDINSGERLPTCLPVPRGRYHAADEFAHIS